MYDSTIHSVTVTRLPIVSIQWVFLRREKAFEVPSSASDLDIPQFNNFNIFIEFCNNHHHLMLEYFHHLPPKNNTLCLLLVTLQYYPQLLANIDLLFVSTHFATSRNLIYMEAYNMYSLCLVSFTGNDVFEVHLCYNILFLIAKQCSTVCIYTLCYPPADRHLSSFTSRPL